MILISCHIDGFGSIVNQDIEFNESLNIFCERNGYGKSTMCEFLKAMFYGLPKKAARQKGIDTRSRFYPLSGNKFGGNLVYRYMNKEYRIERVFDRSKPKNDTFRLYCNGILDTQESENKESIGERLFGIDEEGFEKILFITGDDTNVRPNSSISSKLSESIGLRDNDLTPDDAAKILDDAAKEYAHIRGNGGKINEMKEKISSLRTYLRDERKSADMLPELQREYCAGKTELDRLTKLKESAVKRDLYMKDRERYEAMLSEISCLTSEFDLIKEKYGNSIPSGDDISQLETLASRYDKNSIEFDTIAFSEEKEKELSGLEKKFSLGIPDSSEISDIKNKIAQKADLESEISRSEKVDRYRERDVTLKRRFEGRIPGEGRLSEISEKAEELRNARNDLKSLEKLNASQFVDMNGKGNIFIKLICLVLGAALFFLIYNAIPFSPSIEGKVISAFFGAAAGLAFSEVLRKRRSKQSAEKELSLMIRNNTIECDRLEEEIRSFTVQYGYYSPNGALSDLEMFMSDLNDYFELIKKEKAIEIEKEEKKNMLEALSGEVIRFFGKYEGYTDASLKLIDSFQTLLSDISRLNSLRNEREELAAKRKELAGTGDRIRSHIVQILGKYALPVDDPTLKNLGNIVSQMKLDTYKAKSLSSDIRAKSLQCEKIANGSNFTVLSDSDIPNTDKLEDDITKLREKLIRISDMAESAESSANNAAVLEEKIENAEKELSVLEENYFIVSTASQMLRQSYINLHERYISPIKDVFTEYSELISDVLGDRFIFDKDMSVLVERYGEYMKEEQLSSGERCIVMFCMRLALCRNIFKNDMPFTLLDDPFISLDGEHFEMASSVLKKLSENGQILYFCCHESRNIR